jgi:6-pyruvoyltetrahydropterin/6-carboxytetrahydropterin synthase
LHGHNYHVAAQVQGPLDGDQLVIDFLLLREKLRAITGALDHYVLLPTKHPKLRVEDAGREIRATWEDRRWVFPKGDCRLLPLANTTAELLAAHIGQQLLAALGGSAASIECIGVEVDECDGQIGIWRR